MRAFLWFIGLFAAGFAVIALVAWPAYEWLLPMMDVKKAFTDVGREVPDEFRARTVGARDVG